MGYICYFKVLFMFHFSNFVLQKIIHYYELGWYLYSTNCIVQHIYINIIESFDSLTEVCKYFYNYCINYINFPENVYIMNLKIVVNPMNAECIIWYIKGRGLIQYKDDILPV